MDGHWPIVAIITGEERGQDGARCRIGSRGIFVLFFLGCVWESDGANVPRQAQKVRRVGPRWDGRLRIGYRAGRRVTTLLRGRRGSQPHPSLQIVGTLQLRDGACRLGIGDGGWLPGDNSETDALPATNQRLPGATFSQSMLQAVAFA